MVRSNGQIDEPQRERPKGAELPRRDVKPQARKALILSERSRTNKLCYKASYQDYRSLPAEQDCNYEQQHTASNDVIQCV